jgi:hypothetical protein
MQLYADQHARGGLKMYSTSADTTDPHVGHLAEVFAADAALALGCALDKTELQTALGTRQVSGQATGIVTERFRHERDVCPGRLLQVSDDSRTKVRDVAQDVVDRANTP